MDLVNSNPSTEIIDNTLDKIKTLTEKSVSFGTDKSHSNYSKNIIANLSNKWIELTNEIQSKGEQIKKLREEKNQLECKIFEYLDSNGLKNIQVENGEIELKTNSKKETINEKYIKTILSHKHPGLIDRIMKDLYDERKVISTHKIIKK